MSTETKVEYFLVRYKVSTGEDCQVGPITQTQLKGFLEKEAPNVLEYEVYKKLTDMEIKNRILRFKRNDLFRLLADMEELGQTEGDMTSYVVKRKDNELD